MYRDKEFLPTTYEVHQEQWLQTLYHFLPLPWLQQPDSAHQANPESLSNCPLTSAQQPKNRFYIRYPDRELHEYHLYGFYFLYKDSSRGQHLYNGKNPDLPNNCRRTSGIPEKQLHSSAPASNKK